MSKPESPLRSKLHTIIFEADTPAGKIFDVALLVLILLSVAIVLMESVRAFDRQFGDWLSAAEWFFTVCFTVEYAMRIYVVKKPFRYIGSFMGVIDLLAILPTYFGLFFSGSHYLMTVRIFRLVRIFRIFKLTRYLGEAKVLKEALLRSRAKITVFLITVISIITIMGTVMYLIEGEKNGFSSIPKSIYWAIVTLTTVGYGDIAPRTVLGQFVASIIMILGYAIIAIPTGIVSVELKKASERGGVASQHCRYCSEEGHDADAIYCKKCGKKLNS